jgi:hypothetical protein
LAGLGRAQKQLPKQTTNLTPHPMTEEKKTPPLPPEPATNWPLIYGVVLGILGVEIVIFALLTGYFS